MPGFRHPERSETGRGGWFAAARAATVLVLEQPATWPIALAGFLARGGIALFLIPIVPLPSPVGLANLVGPTAATPSGPSPETASVLALGIALLLVWLVVGSVVGVLADAVLADAFLAGAVGEGAVGEGASLRIDRRPRVSLGLVGRLLGVRLAALLPVGLALAIALRPIVQSTYQQLISPYDLEQPLVARVVREVAPAIGLVVAAWLLAEIVAGLAVRFVVLRNESAGAAVGHAIRHIVRHSASSLATAAVGLAGLVLAIGPPLVASYAVWSLLQAQLARNLAQGGDVGPILLTGLSLAAIWIGGLVLGGVASAWRGLLWTAEMARSEPIGGLSTRTFGRGPVDP
jgi:hypothetical protein